MKPGSLTVTILTLNEELNLPQALDSVVGWADQVFVLDSFSTESRLANAFPPYRSGLSRSSRATRLRTRFQRGWARVIGRAPGAMWEGSLAHKAAARPGNGPACAPREASSIASASRRCRLRPVLVLALLALTACSGGLKAGTVKTLPSAVRSHQQDALEQTLLTSALDSKDGIAYRIGPGDSLLIAVFRHPELSISSYAGMGAASAGGRGAGVVVDNDGTIQFPMLGVVKAEGKTSGELRDELQQRLAKFVKEPEVTIQVLFNGSLRYYLLGEFAQPGLKLADRPMRLLEALALGGSINLPRANLRNAYVARAGRKLPINFFRLLREGDLRQNIRLNSGDTIFVPDNTNDQAFVFAGAATGARGGAVPFVNGRLDLLQALAISGVGFRERAQGRLDQVRVIRSEGDRGQLFVVDADRILRGEAAPFGLEPGDIVFVPESGVTSWNQAIEQILPSLQAISGVLNPFVQIKFLSQ